MNNHTQKTLARFEDISQYGIGTKEVQAAVECLRRELERKPTLDEVADYLERYIIWRRDEMRWRNGEIILHREYTTRGNKARCIGNMVTNIFHNWKKKKGGE